MEHTLSVCHHCNSLNKVDVEKALRNQALCGKCGSSLLLHGLVTNVNAENMNRIIRASEKAVVVDFWADWCGPCKVYGPEFEKASKRNRNAVFLKVDTEAERELSAQLGIRGIPCTIIFKAGKEVKRQPGAMSADQLKELLQDLV